jgi:predicted nuclease of predicted toxin-antitoxin system
MNIKLNENLPARMLPLLERQSHDVHMVHGEQLTGWPDAEIWHAVVAESRLFIAQDLDCSNARQSAPITDTPACC